MSKGWIAIGGLMCFLILPAPAQATMRDHAKVNMISRSLSANRDTTRQTNIALEYEKKRTKFVGEAGRGSKMHDPCRTEDVFALFQPLVYDAVADTLTPDSTIENTASALEGGHRRAIHDMDPDEIREFEARRSAMVRSTIIDTHAKSVRLRRITQEMRKVFEQRAKEALASSTERELHSHINRSTRDFYEQLQIQRGMLAMRMNMNLNSEIWFSERSTRKEGD